MIVLSRFILLCAVVLVLPTIAASTALDGSAGFIEVKAGLLSVNLRNGTLIDVLRTVEKQAGVRVSIQGDLGNVQPQAFSDVPLPEGITRLVQNTNADLIMIYSRDMAGHMYLEEIRAYEGNRNKLTSLPEPPSTSAPAPPPLPVHLRHTTSAHR